MPDASAATNVVRFTVEPRAPFSLDLTAWALRRRPDNVVDRLEAGTYRRVLSSDGATVALAVRQGENVDAPRLEVEAIASSPVPDLARMAARSLDHILGLSHEMAGFDRLAAADSHLGPLAARLRGIRPPRYPTAFEALVNAVACQQITLSQGIRVLNRLVEAHGLAFGDVHAFPRPADLAGADPQRLRALGLSSQKARTIVEAAQRVASGDLDLEALASLDDEAAIARLTALKGVGRWTAEYVLLRGLGRVQVFPGDDSGLRRNLTRWLDLQALDFEGTRTLLARWHPYAGLVYLCLLTDRLIAAGYVQPSYGPTGDASAV